MSDYTPTTEEVREWFTRAVCNCDNEPCSARTAGGAEFDRWFAQHDAAIRSDEREQAAQRAEAEMRLHTGHFEWLSVQDKDVLDAIRNVAAACGEDTK